MTDNQLLVEAVAFLGRTEIGVLITRDEDAYPHARWMTAMAVDGLSRLFTMSADGTRKIAHIEGNPRVC